MPKADSDAGLVMRLRRREAGAAEALVAEYGDRVYGLARRISGNTADAEEIAQDALWAASRKIDTFREDAAFASWLYRITANAAYQKLRKRRTTRHELSWDALDGAAKDSRREPAQDWSGRAKDPAIQSELRTVLESAIAALPARLHTAFVLRDVEDFPYLEIAAALGANPATIKSRIHRARLFLRRRLDQYMNA